MRAPTYGPNVFHTNKTVHDYHACWSHPLPSSGPRKQTPRLGKRYIWWKTHTAASKRSNKTKIYNISSANHAIQWLRLLIDVQNKSDTRSTFVHGKSRDLCSFKITVAKYWLEGGQCSFTSIIWWNGGEVHTVTQAQHRKRQIFTMHPAAFRALLMLLSVGE